MILWLLFWSFYTWVHCIFYKHTHGLVGSSINFSIVNTAYDRKVQVQVDFVFLFVIFIWLSGFLLLIYRYQFIIYDTFIFVSVLSLIILDFIKFNKFHKQHIFLDFKTDCIYETLYFYLWFVTNSHLPFLLLVLQSMINFIMFFKVHSIHSNKS